jgi:hypothetical protein
MKIISNFKDYYDFVAHIYGGGDPLNIWVRKDTSSPPFAGANFVTFDTISVKDTGLSSKSWEKKGESWGWQMEFCVLNGKAYPTLKKWTCNETLRKWTRNEQTACIYESWKILKTNHPFVDFYLQHNNKRYSSLRAEEQIEKWLNPKESVQLIEISRQLKQPTFIMLGRNSVYGQLPRLGELGFAALFSPEQAYQDLSQFVGNHLRESPDVNPPVTVSDRDRILQHGFDIKKSFRQ